jgi:glycerol transport system permease protein
VHDGQDRQQKAWFLVLPVFLIVAFSAVLPLMTVVNYSVQDTFGNNQFFWNGVGWFKEMLDPSSDLGGRSSRRCCATWLSPRSSSPSKCRSAFFVALSMPRDGWRVAVCLVMMALPLLIPWNVVGTIWQIFGRVDIGLLGYTLKAIGYRLQLRPSTESMPGPPSSSWMSGTGPASWRCCATPA